MRKTNIILAFAAFLFSNTNAASFNCSNATTNVEHLICNIPHLSKQDDEMASLYRNALKNGERERIKSEQKKFLKELKGCLDSSCISNLMGKRIISLGGSNSSSEMQDNPSVAVNENNSTKKK